MKCLVQVSGGLDSAASLLWALRQEEFLEGVEPVFYDYGQIYLEPEYKAAALLRGKLSYHYHHLRLLTVERIPLQRTMPGPVPEYVPHRNLVLTAHSLNYAAALECRAVVVGSKSMSSRPEDPYSFRDSTLAFYRYLADTIKISTEANQLPIDIRMPLCGWDKADVLAYLIEGNVFPSDLWTCYTAGPKPCGKCYHCEEYEKGMRDPRVQKAMVRAIK